MKALYLAKKNKQGAIKVAAAVSVKTGTAVWRNRIKRLIKESFRLNKAALMETCIRQNVYLRLVLSPCSLNQINSENIKRIDLEPGVLDLLNQVKKKI